MEEVRRDNHIRHKGNSVQGTIITIRTVDKYFKWVSCRISQWTVSRRRVIQLPIRTRVRATSPTIMWETEVKNQRHRTGYPESCMITRLTVWIFCVYYKWITRELKGIHTNRCRCEKLKTKTEGSTSLGLHGDVQKFVFIFNRIKKRRGSREGSVTLELWWTQNPMKR